MKYIKLILLGLFFFGCDNTDSITGSNIDLSIGDEVVEDTSYDVDYGPIDGMVTLSRVVPCIDSVEVELWNVCYNIEGTTWLNLNWGQWDDNGEWEQLTGEIPPEIGNLINLETLYLQNNLLTGSIPPEIGQLTNLKTLNFYNNQLTGDIPPEIGNITDMDYLHLGDNQLSGIPESISNCNVEWGNSFPNFSWEELEEMPGYGNFGIQYNSLCEGSYPIWMSEYITSDTQNCN